MANPIVTENQNTGTTAWKFQSGKQATTQIQGYTDATSYNPGDTVTFFVSTQVASTGYSIRVYRMGYYSGNGGCLKTTISGLTGIAQGYWDGAVLQNCPTAIIDGTTHSCEAGWASVATWAIPSNAVTGVYLVQFTDANGMQSLANFVVKSNSNADYVLIRPYETDQAYNDWGGYSLYTSPTVGVKVSFNRPDDTQNGGSTHLLWYELACIKWFESMGYNLSYLSDVDVHVNSALLLTYGACLFLGHDEYWTKERRDGVETARAQGIGLAFLGSNACYWQVRLGNDNAGHANRMITCYKVTSAANNLATDPFNATDKTRLTTNWRDAALNRPECALVGIQYSNNGTNTYAWTVDASANSQLLTGTGLVAGQSYGCDPVGGEWDTTFPASPNNLQILGSTPVTGVNGSSVSKTTTYIASGGALVFATGSFYWTWSLDSYRRFSTSCAQNALVVPEMQQLMAHIMTTLIRPKQPTGFSAFSAHL